MNNCFFDESNEALGNITRLFDLIWPITIATWNMRTCVSDLLRKNPKMTNKDFNKIFNIDKEVKGVNYTRNFIEKSWNQQKSELAFLLLTQAISSFEGWLAELVNNHFPKSNIRSTRARIEDLQFPTSINNQVQSMNSPQSSFMTTQFYAQFSSLKKRQFNRIQNLLICYRVFKEIRNCYIHNNNKTSQNLIDNINDYFASITSSTDLGTSVLPNIHLSRLGEPIVLDIKDAVFASEIIISIILSIDSELTKSQKAENLMIERIKNSKWFNSQLSSNHEKRSKQLVRIFEHIGKTQKPSNIEDAGTFLKDKHILFF